MGPPPNTAPPHLDLLRGVTLSLSGQGLERRGRAPEALDRFGRAAALLDREPDVGLKPHDRSDYGVALAALGRDDEARLQLLRAREENGETPEAARHLARLLLDGEEVGAAERLLAEALQVVPTDADAFVLVGRAQALRGNPAAAVTYHQAAYLFLSSDRPGDALATLNAARDLVGSEDRAVRGLRAEALRMEGRHEEARAVFDRALADEPDNPWLLGRRGATLAALGATREAAAELDRATELAPDDVTVLMLAGEAALERADVEAALAYGERALAVDPRQPAAYALRARVERQRQFLGAALDAVRAGRALAPHDGSLLRLNAELEHVAGDTSSAVDLLRRLCGLSEATPGDHWQYADLLAETGRLDDAVTAAAQAVNRWPAEAGLVELHGDLLRRSGQPAESVRVLRRAAELDPRSARARLLLALSLSETGGDHQDVTGDPLDALTESLELAPEWAEPHYLRAAVLADRQGLAKARPAIEAALARDPDHPGALELLAEIQLDAGEAKAAEELARRLVARFPNEASPRLLVARALLDEGQPAKALKVLADVPPDLDSVPDHWAQWLLLRGKAYTQERRWEDAERDLSRLVELRPELAEAWFHRAELSRHRGAARQTLEYADRALGLEPGHIQAQGTRAAALMGLGRVTEAREALDSALHDAPDYVFALLLMAQLEAAEDPERARALLEQAISLDPSNRMLHLEKGWLHLAAGAVEEALVQFDRLLDENRDADALSGRSEALRLLGQPAEAIEAAEQALDLRPDDRQALHSLGFALLAIQDRPQALEVFRKALECYPGDVRAMADLGYASAAVDDIDTALGFLDEACSASPVDAWPLTRLAQVLLDVAHYDGAEQLFRRALEVDRDDLLAWYGLGWALQYRDPPLLEEAHRAYEQALYLDPDNLWVRKSLANTLHLRGLKEDAARRFSEVLTEAERRRSEQPDMLGLVGWCAFRLGDFTKAARALYELISINSVPGVGRHRV